MREPGGGGVCVWGGAARSTRRACASFDDPVLWTGPGRAGPCSSDIDLAAATDRTQRYIRLSVHEHFTAAIAAGGAGAGGAKPRAAAS